MTLNLQPFKHSFLYALLVAAALLASACDSLKRDDRQRVVSAKQYLENQDVRAAAIELQNALQLNPGNAEARYLLANINLSAGSAEIAEKEFRRAGQQGAPMEEISVGLALAQLEQKHYEQLLDELTISEEWSPETRASLLGIRAAAEVARGSYPEARETLGSASLLQPENLHVLTGEAKLFIAEKNWASADGVLVRAHSLYPENQEILFLMAGIAYQNDRRDEIAQLLARIIDVDLPGIITVYEWRARIGLAQLLMEQGRTEEAQEAIEPLMSRIQRDADSLYLAALLSFKLGEYELAGQHLHKVLELKADHRPALFLLGSVNYLLEEYEQAAYYLSKYVATVPGDVPARKLLGQTYFELNAHSELKEVLQPLLADRHSDAEVVAMIGMSALRAGQMQAGVAEIEKAVAMSPDNTRLREYLARAYILSGEPDRAIKELENVLDAGSNERHAEVLLILAHLRSGNSADARAVAVRMVRAEPNNPRILTIAGNVFLASGDSEKAQQYFSSALQLQTDYLPARMAMARVFENHGEFGRARTQYENLIATAGNKLLPMLALANLEERQGDLERMLFWLKKAIALDPPQAAPRILLANYYLTQGDMDSAAKMTDEALAIEPGNLSAGLLQVRTLMAKGKYTQALPVLNEWASRKPESQSVSLLLAESNLRLGRSDEALQLTGKIIVKQPDSIPANMLMAAASISSQRYEQALVHAARLKELKPDWHKGYEVEGDVHMAMGNYEKAEEAYTVAMQYAQVPELTLKIAQVYMHTQRLDGAAQKLEAWHAMHGEHDRILLSLGITYQLQNRLEKAVGAYEGVLAIHPENSVALNNLAGILDTLGDPRALGFAERAYRRDASAPNIQDTYGWLLTKNGKAAEGRRLLEDALKTLPDNPDIRYHLSVALFETGEGARAKSLLKRLLEQDISFDSRQEAIEFYEKIK